MRSRAVPGGGEEVKATNSPHGFSYKGRVIGYDGYKKVNGNELSALVDQNGLPLACSVAPANVHDSQLYEPTGAAFEIPGIDAKPSVITADAAFDSQEIRSNTRKRRMRSSIPVNPRNGKSPKRGRPVLFHRDLAN
ncbi:MAG: transposase, partial [Methanomicrobiales archaeon]|nr:transposase [Methanomicrobiales archaeon]